MQHRFARHLAELGQTCRQPQLFLLNFGYLGACLPLVASMTGLIGATSLAVPASFAALGAFGLWLALTHPPKGHAAPGNWAMAALLPGAGLALAVAHRPGPSRPEPGSGQNLQPC